VRLPHGIEGIFFWNTGGRIVHNQRQDLSCRDASLGKCDQRSNPTRLDRRLDVPRQQAFPFPPEVASAYGATPPVFNTQYFILNDGSGLTLEGWVKPGFTGELLSITGGIGSLSRAAGFTEEAPLGENATMCPNFRATLHFRPGSFQGGASQ
jgi:hypothetical protein